MAVADTVKAQDAVLAAYRFLDALNERDADALAALATPDVELHTSDGHAWVGSAGTRARLETAKQKGWRLVPLHRGEHAEERGADVWIELRVREVAEDDDEPRIADFVVRDGRVASLTLRPMPYEPGLP